MTVRKAITAAVSAHAQAVQGLPAAANHEDLIDLNRKAENAVSLIMDAADDDAALTEKIISRLSIQGGDGKQRLVLLSDEIEDREQFISHHRAAASAIASAAKARRVGRRP